MPNILQPRKVNPNKPVVALTFDDGPSVHTTRILNVLQQYDERATFFVQGNKVEEHKTKILRATHMGCEIVCHAWDHTDLTTISKRKIEKQLFETIKAIAKVTGDVSLMFRPPYGYINDKVRKVAHNLGLAIINWSLDPRDWESLSANAIYDYIATNVQNGDIILCHDVHESTAEAMERLIPDLVEQGCQLVTVTELLLYKYGKIIPGRLYLS